MQNYEWKQGRVDSHNYWKIDEIKNLKFKNVPFNDIEKIKYWKNFNYQARTGYLYNMTEKNQPETTKLLIDWAKNLKNVGISYYKMISGDNLPYHSDLYKQFIKIFNLENEKNKIWRYNFFVEDWKPGHIFEIAGNSITKWKSGDYIAWNYDVPHLAANLGDEPRYTIQVTGVEN